MMRTCLLALGIGLGIAGSGWAQERAVETAETASKDAAPELTMASLETPAPPAGKEPAPVVFSGVGYYSAPNSEGAQSFLIEDRTGGFAELEQDAPDADPLPEGLAQ